MKSVYRILALMAMGGLMVLAAAAYALGIASYERYSGYFAPIWDRQAKGVFFIQRDTSGFIWGAGWEGFSPPARSYPLSDTFSLRYLAAGSGRVDVLQSWPGSPLAGRTTLHYRGKIFNFVSVRLEPADGTIEFVIKLQIPQEPTSENWTLTGTWRRDEPANAKWSQKWSSTTGISDATLKAGMEVIPVRGRESFPAAIVAIHADGSHRVLIKNNDFDRLYPDGIPAQRITERSWRAQIERVRKLSKTRRELEAKHKTAGLSELEASLKASDDLEDLGLLPKQPRLVAKVVIDNPDNLKIFSIPPEYFTVGLFHDIAAAIAKPGTLVATGTGTYLKYYDDELGPQLKAWRAAGNDRFIVSTNSMSYLLEVRRFE